MATPDNQNAISARGSSGRAARQPLTLVSVAPTALLVAALGLRLVGAGLLGYLLLAIYALLGPAHAVRALALSWLFALLSPGIATEGSASSIGRYAALLAAAASVFLRSRLVDGKGSAPPFVLYTIAMGGFFVVHAMFFSPYVDVSALKAISWTLSAATLAGAWLMLSPSERDGLANQIFNGLVALMIVSLLLSVTSIGYLTNGTGLQGALNNPQAFGAGMALLGAWAAGRMLGESRPAWTIMLLVGAALGAILLSEARTAGLAMLLGLGLAVIIVPLVAGRSTRDMVPGLRSKRVILILVTVAVALAAAAPFVATIAFNYITKSNRAEVGTILEAYDVSRGGLIRVMLANIERDPWTGIGFGIASDPRMMQVERDPLLGLPTGAVIEKGVTAVAVVEEVGIFGALMVAVWIIWVVRRAARGGLAPLAVTMTIILLNMGDATLFSAGGFGLITLVLLTWAFASAPPRAQRRALRRGAEDNAIARPISSASA